MTTTLEMPHCQIIDIEKTLATNYNCPPPLEEGWWQRELTQITGLTIHHTLSHSPWATARSYVNKGGGRPSIPYHFWVCSCGRVMRCLALTEGCWHDHTGDKNTNVSIGLAGSLHIKRPPDHQIFAAAELIVYLVRSLDLYPSDVQGHNERSKPAGFPTACPGWLSKRAGRWKLGLFGRVTALLTHPNGAL